MIIVIANLLKKMIFLTILSTILISSVTAVGLFNSSFGADSTDTSAAVESSSPGHPPAANAGDDLTVKENEKISLDASQSSDPDGDQLKYNWKLLSPKRIKLDIGDTNSKVLSFNTPSLESNKILVLVFKLTVSDGTFL